MSDNEPHSNQKDKAAARLSSQSHLRKLSRMEVAVLGQRFTESALHGDTPSFQAFYNTLQINAQIELPLGELLNPDLEGFFWGWRMSRGSITTHALPEHHQYAAQGIEGMIRIEWVTLSQALLVADITGPFRIEIFVPCHFQMRNVAQKAVPPSQKSTSVSF